MNSSCLQVSGFPYRSPLFVQLVSHRLVEVSRIKLNFVVLCELLSNSRELRRDFTLLTLCIPFTQRNISLFVNTVAPFLRECYKHFITQFFCTSSGSCCIPIKVPNHGAPCHGRRTCLPASCGQYVVLLDGYEHEQPANCESLCVSYHTP